MNNMTFAEQAAQAQAEGRLGTFDTALPQDFADHVHALTGEWPQHVGVVWYYPAIGPDHLFGRPFALNDYAEALLDLYAMAVAIGVVEVIVIEVEATA